MRQYIVDNDAKIRMIESIWKEYKQGRERVDKFTHTLKDYLEKNLKGF